MPVGFVKIWIPFVLQHFKPMVCVIIMLLSLKTSIFYIGGTPMAGPQGCFDDNTQGDQFGNCGHTSTDYLACASE